MLFILLPVICKERGSPFGAADNCRAYSLTYVSLSMAVSIRYCVFGSISSETIMNLKHSLWSTCHICMYNADRFYLYLVLCVQFSEDVFRWCTSRIRYRKHLHTEAADCRRMCRFNPRKTLQWIWLTWHKLEGHCSREFSFGFLVKQVDWIIQCDKFIGLYLSKGTSEGVTFLNTWISFSIL